MQDITLPLIVALVALGMALAFVSADRRSSTSRALAMALAFTGLSLFLNQVFVPDASKPPPWSGWLAITETGAIIYMLEWQLRVRRTVPAPAEFNTLFGDRVLRIGQLSGVLYFVFALTWPGVREQEFLRSLGEGTFTRGGFWLFATPVLVSVLAGLVSMVLLFNRKPDVSEQIRLLAFAASVPFCVAGLILPTHWGAISIVVGEMTLLVGAVHYHVLQGQRGLFMSRFLSPEVARLVAQKGLHSAMQEQHLTLSVVACDLRGFSRFARETPSARVIHVLREYYDSVGRVVAQYGGTIKDYAGDGILILVGAPIALPDHAHRALALAVELRAAVQDLIELWRPSGPPLGIGVGVATGPVTVGVIGGSARLEYTAVGSAVNLASRLCEHADDGEILVDDVTLKLVGPEQAQAREPISLKGFAEPVLHFGV
jgi:class 3 adenylate cyclase